jgi:hypothetical protein
VVGVAVIAMSEVAVTAAADSRAIHFSVHKIHSVPSPCEFSKHGVQWVAWARGSPRFFQAFVKRSARWLYTITSEFISRK